MAEKTEAKALSYELNSEMLEIIHNEFNPEKMAEKLKEAIKGKKDKEIEAAGKELFSNLGAKWIRRAMELGEQYPDRTFEVLKESIDHLGGYYKFALLPQRSLEIAYLAIMDFRNLTVMENWARALVYRIPDCRVYKEIAASCGEKTAKLMTCQHFCFSALDTIHRDLEIDAVTGIEALMAKDGYCQFAARRP